MKKLIPYNLNELKVGMKVSYYSSLDKSGKVYSHLGYNSSGFFSRISEEMGEKFVILHDLQREIRISVTDKMSFFVEADDDWYKNEYKEGLKEKLNNRLANYEIGKHTMWNGFDMIDPYRMAHDLKESGYDLIGICYNVPYTNSINCDAAICFEDTIDFEKFWVHCKSSWIEDMIEQLEKDGY